MTNNIVLLGAMIAVLRCTLPAQVEDPHATAFDQPTSFLMDALSFKGQDSGKSRLDVFTQVGYDNLTFVKTGNTYRASYELTATVLDSSGSVVKEIGWTEEVNESTFDATVAAGVSKMASRSFALLPGQYTVDVQLRNAENKAARRIQEVVVVPDFRVGSFSLSSLMLVARLSYHGEKRSVVPSISSNVGNIPDAMHLFFEVYNNSGKSDSVRFSAVVRNRKEEVVLTSDTVQYCVAGRNEVFLQIDQRSLPVGEYAVVVTAAPSDHHLQRASALRSFSVRWHGLPSSLSNLDDAVEQLRYIASSSELDSIKTAPTQEEKRKRFSDFWKKKNPNPNTPRNERMVEFYARVEFANRHFAHFMDGWKTDMGMVYIIFGPPGNVERHPFESDSKPYEVWTYYAENQTFVFVDESGLGEYHLITPMWEVYRKAKQY